MLRNGFIAARRPLLAAIAPPPRLPHPESTFVCLSCRIRSVATAVPEKKRRGRPPKANPNVPPVPKKRGRPPKSTKSKAFSAKEHGSISMDEIKRLEAHVQTMEQNYKDLVKQKEIRDSLPATEITDDLSQEAYAALMAPEETSIFLPEPRTMDMRLPPPVRDRLGSELVLAKTSVQPEWGNVLLALEEKGGFADFTTGMVNKVISLMELPQRAKLSRKILDMMKVGEIEPKTLTYDFLMMAHASQKNSNEVKALFNELKERDLKPTVFTYSHLLKAYSHDADVVSAATAFKEMQAAGIEPNLVVYTMLIQTCVKRKEYDTAWQIFNLIKFKSTATAPDANTYSLMISACAHTQEAERAMDLYTDMTVRRGLMPNKEVYHALVHACAVRKDYFHQGFKYAQEMKSAGMTLDRMVLNVLLQACGRVGELTRARLMVRHMAASGQASLQPDKYTFQSLLRCYAVYFSPSTKDRPKVEENNATYVGPEMNLIDMKDKRPEEIPFMEKPVLHTWREVLDEAGLIVSWLREEKPEMVDTQMLNAYLEVCVRQKGFNDLVWSYRNDFENPPKAVLPKDPEEQQDEVEKTSDEKPQAEKKQSIEEPRTSVLDLRLADISTDLANHGKQAEVDQINKEQEQPQDEKEQSIEERRTTVLDLRLASISTDLVNHGPIKEQKQPQVKIEQSIEERRTTVLDLRLAKVSTGLANHRLQAEVDQPTKEQEQPQPAPEAEPAPSAPFNPFDLKKFPRNIHTYRAALQAALESRNLSFAREVWEDRIAYTESEDYWRKLPKMREKLDREAELAMVDILALTGMLGEAGQRAVYLAEEGGIEWHWQDLRRLYTKAVQLEDPETIAIVRRLCKVGADNINYSRVLK